MHENNIQFQSQVIYQQFLSNINNKDSKKMFEDKYIQVEVIKQQKSKKTSIVTDRHGKFYIAKRITINNAQIQHEIEMLKSLKHPNLVNLHQVLLQQNNVYLVEEYCEEGDLGYHMLRRTRNKRKHYLQETIANWILQVLMALQYMHARNVIHRDIRPDNIMLTAKGNLKLGSLKFSKVLEIQTGLGLAFTVMTSPYYSAPECVQEQGYTQKVDIWAIGCLIQQLCTLKSTNVIESAKRTTRGKIQPLPLIYSAELNQIYTSCLQSNPVNRPTAEMLLKTPYFITIMKSFIQSRQKESKQQKKVKRKIPIKRYNIHKMNEQKKKIEQFRQLNLQRVQNIEKTSNYLMKKSSLDQNRYKMSSKQDVPYNIKIKGVQELENDNKNSLMRKSSVQTRKERQKLPEIKTNLTRSKSRQITKRLSVNKSENQDKNPSLSSIQYEQTGTKSPKSPTDPKPNIIDSPPKKLPPMMPPPAKKNPNPKTPQQKQRKKIVNAQHFKLITQNKQKEEGKKFEQDVKSSMSKVFENLLSVKNQSTMQDDQLSFDLSDEEDVRVNSAKNQEKQVVDSYKTKLQQLIDWMNCKYSPNMEVIMERTMEMDSNTFAKLKE